MKKYSIGNIVKTGLKAGAVALAYVATTAGCASTPARKATLQDYLAHSKGQVIQTSEDKKFTPEEMKDIGETYCILHDFQQRGVKDEKQKAEVDGTLEVLGKIITAYMEKGSASHEDFAYVGAVEEGKLVNNGGNVPMPARLTAEQRAKLYATVRDQAEGLRRLKTAWENVQTSDGQSVDSTAWHQFYRHVKEELFRELLDATPQDRFGGGSVPGERESQWTLEDHKQYFGEGKTEKNKGRTTAMGLVSDYELPVDKDLEEVIKAFTAEKKEEKKEEKDGKKEDAKEPESKEDEEKAEKDKAEKEKAEREKAEKESMSKRILELERALEKEKADRAAAEKAEKERLAREAAEKERLAAESAEKERIEREKAEREAAEKEKSAREKRERALREMREEKEKKDREEREKRDKAEREKTA